jgi:hypothetical protein
MSASSRYRVDRPSPEGVYLIATAHVSLAEIVDIIAKRLRMSNEAAWYKLAPALAVGLLLLEGMTQTGEYQLLPLEWWDHAVPEEAHIFGHKPDERDGPDPLGIAIVGWRQSAVRRTAGDPPKTVVYLGVRGWRVDIDRLWPEVSNDVVEPPQPKEAAAVPPEQRSATLNPVDAVRAYIDEKYPDGVPRGKNKVIAREMGVSSSTVLRARGRKK